MLNLKELASEWGLNLTGARYALVASGAADMCGRHGKEWQIPPEAIAQAETWRKEHGRKPVPEPLDLLRQSMEALDQQLLHTGQACVARMRRNGVTERAEDEWASRYLEACNALMGVVADGGNMRGVPGHREARAMNADTWLELYKRSALHVMSSLDSTPQDRANAQRFLQEFTEEQQREEAEAGRRDILAKAEKLDE